MKILVFSLHLECPHCCHIQYNCELESLKIHGNLRLDEQVILQSNVAYIMQKLHICIKYLDFFFHLFAYISVITVHLVILFSKRQPTLRCTLHGLKTPAHTLIYITWTNVPAPILLYIIWPQNASPHCDIHHTKQPTSE